MLSVRLPLALGKCNLPLVIALKKIKLMMEEDVAKKAEHCNPNITPTQLNDKFSSETPGTCDESESEDEVVILGSVPEESFKN